MVGGWEMVMRLNGSLRKNVLEENYGKSQLKMDGFCTGGHPVYPPGI